MADEHDENMSSGGGGGLGGAGPESCSLSTASASTADQETVAAASAAAPAASTPKAAPGGGLDNPAFETSGEEDRLDASPSSSPSPQKGDDAAVNLELVNLTPTQPPKIMANDATNDADATDGQQMSHSDSKMEKENHYREYFVPVNEHKKGLRGEKLYVTKDCREKSQHCRKYFCATVGVVFLVAALAVALLVGVGVIDPQPDNSRNIKGGRSRQIENENDENGPRVSGILHPNSNLDGISGSEDRELGEKVPAAYEGQFRITNLAWDDRLSDKSSPMFQELASNLEREILASILADNSPEEGPSKVSIAEFTSGSVIVKFRITWPEDSNEQEGKQEVLQQLMDRIKSNSGFLSDVYKVDGNSIVIDDVRDECEHKSCQHACIFQRTSNDFICVCPTGFNLNMDGRTCGEPFTTLAPLETTAEQTTQQSESSTMSSNWPQPLMPIGETTTDSVIGDTTTDSITATTTVSPTERVNILPESAESVPEVTETPKHALDDSDYTTAQSEMYTSSQLAGNTAGTTTETSEITTVDSMTNMPAVMTMVPDTIGTVMSKVHTVESTINPQVPINVSTTSFPTMETTTDYQETTLIPMTANLAVSGIENLHNMDTTTASQDSTAPPMRNMDTTAVSQETTVSPMTPNSDVTMGTNDHIVDSTTVSQERTVLPIVTTEASVTVMTNLPNIETNTVSQETTMANEQLVANNQIAETTMVPQKPQTTVVPQMAKTDPMVILDDTTVDVMTTILPMTEPAISISSQTAEVTTVIPMPEPQTVQPSTQQPAMFSTDAPVEARTQEVAEGVKVMADTTAAPAMETHTNRNLPLTTQPPMTNEDMMTMTALPAAERVQEEEADDLDLMKLIKMTTTSSVEEVMKDATVLPPQSQETENREIVFNIQLAPKPESTTTTIPELSPEPNESTQTPQPEMVKETTTMQHVFQSADDDFVAEQFVDNSVPKTIVINLPPIFETTTSEDSEIITTAATIKQNEAESPEEATTVLPDNNQETSTYQEDSSILNVNIPIIRTGLNTEELEKALREVVFNVTRHFETSTSNIEENVATSSIDENVTTSENDENATYSNIDENTTIPSIDNDAPTLSIDENVVTIESVDNIVKTTTVKNMDMPTTTFMVEETTTDGKVEDKYSENGEFVSADDHFSNISDNSVLFDEQEPEESNNIVEKIEDNDVEVNSEITTVPTDSLEDTTGTESLISSPPTVKRSNEATPRKLNIHQDNSINQIEHSGKKITEESGKDLKEVDIFPVVEPNLPNQPLCDKNEFQCNNGDCIKQQLRCDLINDCVDRSDETECDSAVCLPGEFQCSSGRCLPDALKCDRRADCPNAEDELGCESACESGHFLCPEGRCLPDRLRCDGQLHCLDGSDEAQCDCDPETEFKCALAGGCVKRAKRCDGHYDCADRSDELGCARLGQGQDDGQLQIRSQDDSWLPVCSDNWTDNWSDMTCRQLGRPGAVTTTTIGINDTSSTLSFNTTSAFDEPLAQTVVYEQDDEVSGNCTETVGLTCAELECGQWQMGDFFPRQVAPEDDLSPTSGSSAAAQWPSVAYLFNVQTKSSCTVSIVGQKWLLTSHRCIEETDPNPLQWVAFGGPAGPNSHSPDGLKSGTQIRMIARIVSHPSAHFAQGVYRHDLALVELVEPFHFDGMVGAVCLGGEDPEEEERVDVCVTAGWADAGPGGLSFHQYLNVVATPNYELAQCNSSDHYNGLLGNDVICAGPTADEEEAHCRSDFGAPLMCRNSQGVWQLRGVLSLEGGSCRSGGSGGNGGSRNQQHPDVYTSVQKLRAWIEGTVGVASGL